MQLTIQSVGDQAIKVLGIEIEIQLKRKRFH